MEENPLIAAAVEIATQHGLPAAAVGEIVATLVRHGVGTLSSTTTATEVTTSEAAELLNVDRKTLRKYIAGGLLSFRNKAAPGSTQPRRMIPMADIRRLQEYGFEAPATPTPLSAGRRGRTSQVKFKHVDLNVSF